MALTPLIMEPMMHFPWLRLLSILAILVLASCAHIVPVSPAPSTAASFAGTAATKKSVTNTKSLIKKAQDAAARGDTSIDKADALITTILKQP